MVLRLVDFADVFEGLSTEWMDHASHFSRMIEERSLFVAERNETARETVWWGMHRA